MNPGDAMEAIALEPVDALTVTTLMRPPRCSPRAFIQNSVGTRFKFAAAAPNHAGP
jgi:hypothetical protein